MTWPGSKMPWLLQRKPGWWQKKLGTEFEDTQIEVDQMSLLLELGMAKDEVSSL